MAKLPGLKESVRLGQGTPVAAVSDTAGKLRGAAVSQLGKSVASFGGAIAKAVQADKAASDRIFRDRFTNKANDAVNTSLFNARKESLGTNGEGMVDTFSQGLQPLVDEINSLGGQQKNIAINAFEKARIAGVNKARAASVQFGSDFLKTQFDTNFSESLAIIELHPEEMQNEVNKMQSLLQDTAGFFLDPITGGDGSLSLLHTYKTQAAKAALTGIMNTPMDDGKYARARDFVRSKAGNNFSAAERINALENIDAIEIGDYSRDIKFMTLRRTEEKITVDIQSERKREELLNEMSATVDISRRADIVQRAENWFSAGLLKKADYQMIEAASTNIVPDITNEHTALEIQKAIVGGKVSGTGIHKMVKDAVRDKKLQLKTARGFLLSIPKTGTRDAKTSARRRAKEMLKNRFYSDKFNFTFNDGYDAALLEAVQSTAYENEWKHGLNPLESMKRSLKKHVGFLQPVVKSISSDLHRKGREQELRKAAKEKLKKINAVPKSKRSKIFKRKAKEFVDSFNIWNRWSKDQIDVDKMLEPDTPPRTEGTK